MRRIRATAQAPAPGACRFRVLASLSGRPLTCPPRTKTGSPGQGRADAYFLIVSMLTAFDGEVAGSRCGVDRLGVAAEFQFYVVEPIAERVERPLPYSLIRRR